MLPALALLACARGAGAADAPDPAPSLSGTGMLTLPDTATLAPGRFTLGVALDNRDRDPLGLDFFDYAVAWTAGLPARLETYGRWTPSRVTSLPEEPVLPPPPLDLVVLSGSVPERPYYAIHPAAPYVNKRGDARFGAFVPGDLVAGLKWRLRDARGAAPAVALGAETKMPLGRDLDDLQSGSGTGALDWTARVAAQWAHGPADFVASAAYTRTGRGRIGDRVIRAADGRAWAFDDQPLVLPDRLDLGLALRRRLGRRTAAVLEGTAAPSVGARSPTLDAATPLDLIAGIQSRLGRARIALGLRYHGHALPSGERRPAPLAGLVDVTGVDAAVLADWLRAAGAADALPAIRGGTQRLLAGVPPELALPEGARVIPADYAIRSEHQLGFVAVCAWTF